jgi:hypothetical protein
VEATVVAIVTVRAITESIISLDFAATNTIIAATKSLTNR